MEAALNGHAEHAGGNGAGIPKADGVVRRNGVGRVPAEADKED